MNQSRIIAQRRFLQQSPISSRLEINGALLEVWRWRGINGFSAESLL